MSSLASPPLSLVLYSAGSNAQNQLSHSQQEDSHVFLPCIASASSSSTGELNSSSFPPPQTRSILQLAFGANHTTCLLETDNGRRQIWGCGDGEGGQLGLSAEGEEEGTSKEGEGGGARGGGFRKLKLPPLPIEVLVELERRAEGTYCYQPIRIAASWTTTFIAFSATLLLPSSTSSPPPRSRRPPSPDLLLAMGTNDFAELGNGRRGRSMEEERFCWHVFQDEKIVDLVSGPRHVLLHLANESSWRLVGWGAARHGQLSAPLSTIPPSINELETPPPPAAVLLVPTSLPSSSSSSTLLSPFTQLALGLHHTLILHSQRPHSSHLQILGRPSNPATQVSLPPSLDASSSSTILQIASTWSSSVLLLASQPNTDITPTDYSILSYSKTPFKPLTLPPNATSPSLRAGSEHVLVLLSVLDAEREEGERKEVWGWGWNEHGNMGDGGVTDWVGLGRVWPSTRTSASSSLEETKGERVVDCWAGNGTSWVLVERD